MAKRKSVVLQQDSRTAVLTKAEATVRTLGFEHSDPIEVDGEPCRVFREQGRPAVLVYVPAADVVTAAVEELAIQLGGTIAGGPADYVWATATGEPGQGFLYCWLPDQECQVSQLPLRTVWERQTAGNVCRPTCPKSDASRFKQLEADFDQLHERVYNARESIDGSNDLTAQLCKCIFLKMHWERHRDFRVPRTQRRFAEVFEPTYIRQHQERAVQEIKSAFDATKALPEYCVTDDLGHNFQIFEAQEFIKFHRPETFALIAEMLNRHELTRPEETGVDDDVLGRAFDVMLRAKFESKGGMGIYLTPQQVRDAMVQMAFHDILREDPGTITRYDEQGRTGLRVCDPCCGSAGFLVTAMRAVRKQVDRLVRLTPAQRQRLLTAIFARGFVGADNSPNMVLLARINMALHGDPQARVFRVANSLTVDILQAESYDLILTNPPFKKGGVTRLEQADLLKAFTTDIDAHGRPRMTGSGLALGAKPDAKGVWKLVNSVDPAVLFIDRCLHLLKPGGRLLMVLPDGILCNSGDRYVREYLMGRKEGSRFVGGKSVLKAVVSLPTVTFRLSGTGAKTSFVYLQKKAPGDEQGAVFMAVANEVGFDVRQNKPVVTGMNDLVRIVESYKLGLELPLEGACEPAVG